MSTQINSLSVRSIGALLFSVLPTVAAAASEASDRVVNAGDLAQLRAAVERDRCAIRAGASGGFDAYNPAQRWHIQFDERGFLVQPSAGAWSWGLELEGFGLAGSERSVTTPAWATAAGGRVTYAWGDGLDEWYVNGPDGLEHGYTLDRRPERAGSEADAPLLLTLGVRGNLSASVVAGGRDVSFLDDRGEVLLSYSGLVVFDADGRSLEAGFELAGSGLRLTIDDRQARYPITVDPIAQQVYLKPSNPDAASEFGLSVAVSGDTVAVGAPLQDGMAFQSGAAYVFVRQGGVWTEQAYLKASDVAIGGRFGISVALSGDTLVVGALLASDGKGAAYVFERSGTTWSQQARLVAYNADPVDHFGDAVAISGDTILVGAPAEDARAVIDGDGSDNSSPSSGAAYVYTYDGVGWTHQAYLKASNAGGGDSFGHCLSLDGDRALIGAPFEDAYATGVDGNQGNNASLASGAAYIFVRNGGAWTQEAYLKASNTEPTQLLNTGDFFGFSVGLEGDTAVVGAPSEDSGSDLVDGDQNDNGTSNAGAAYVFECDAGTWAQTAYLKAFNSDENDAFGLSVAASQDRLVVGAFGESSSATGVGGDPADNSASSAGAAYTFVRGGTSWCQSGYIKASNTGQFDQFGRSVGLSSGLLVVGAVGEDSGSAGPGGDQSDDSLHNAGAAYVFELTPADIVSYCPSLPNATGSAAVLSAAGDPACSLVLTSAPIPDKVSQFFFGPRMLAGNPFGDGVLCAGGRLTRMLPMVTGGTSSPGTATLELDYSAPYASSLTGTRYFQHWFRSGLATGAGFNTSSGLAVTF